MLHCQIPVLGFAAYSGTGKTTLLKQLIPRLRAQGLRLALIKHAHHDFDLDTPGKDSYELRKAGASQVLIASHKRWVLLHENDTAMDPPLQAMLERIDQKAFDLLLVEGFKHETIAKIELHRSALKRPLLYPEDASVIAVASDAPLPQTSALPQLDLNDVDAIAAFVIAWMKNAPPPEDPREELLTYYRWLHQFGYNDSHSGNASVKDADGFWVTPTGACADTLRLADLIHCPLRGACSPIASLDAPLHQRVYQDNPAAAALLHSHGAYSVAVTLDGKDFRPADFEGQLYFAQVPVLDIPYARYVEQAPAAVAATLAGAHNITVVRGHGVYACAPSLNLAYKWTCSLELSARTYLLARAAGTLPPPDG
jgi:L-fuculose-phosphate aldolase